MFENGWSVWLIRPIEEGVVSATVGSVEIEALESHYCTRGPYYKIGIEVSPEGGLLLGGEKVSMEAAFVVGPLCKFPRISFEIAETDSYAKMKEEGRLPKLPEPLSCVLKLNGKDLKLTLEAVAGFIEDLVKKRKYTGSAGVVTPFRGQANRIRDYLSKIEGLDITASGLLVDTVHKFQGDERDMMIFSPTVSNGISPSALGFLNAQGNLFNVAITRARSRLVTIGDQGACANSGVSYLSAFVEHVGQVNQNHETSRKTSSAAPPDSAEYPAVSNPEMVSEWERRFYRALYKAGIRTIPQYAVDEYRLEFAIIDGDRRLNIEVDGEQFHRNWDGELIDRDQLRNRRLIEQGWQVLRFWVYQIRDHEQACVDEVRKRLGR